MTTTLFEPLITEERYEPTPWQEKDLRFLSPMPYSANWSQMGCYKTSTGLWLIEKKKCKNALIITSKMGKGAYYSDFYRCLPEHWSLYDLSIHTATMVRGEYREKVDLFDLLDRIKTGFHDDPIVLLAHYDMFTTRANVSSRKRTGGRGILDWMESIEWDMILADEAHRLKNRKAQWTINIKKLKAKNRHIMTGTGFVNDPSEMYSLLNFLNKSKWRGYWNFRNYYCDQYIDVRTGYRVITGILPYRRDEFRKLRQDLGPRHLMSTVHRDITKPIEKAYTVDLNSEQKKMYKEIKQTLQAMDKNGAMIQSPNVLSQLNRLRQISVATPVVVGKHFDNIAQRMVTEITLEEPSSKLDLTMDIIEQLDDDDQKIVVFSCFRDPLDMLAARLQKKDIGFTYLKQSDTDAIRYFKWHDEFRRSDKKVFLSTLALGGESINLTCAQYLIFLDRSWSPKDNLQAVGRVYRPGQTGGAEIIYLNSKGTVDSYVLDKLQKKEKWFNEIFAD